MNLPDRLKLTCMVNGIPKPTITWYKVFNLNIYTLHINILNDTNDYFRTNKFSIHKTRNI